MKKISERMEVEAYNLMLKIESSPSHALPVSEMTKDEQRIAKILEGMYWIEFVPANHGVSQSVEQRNRYGDPISYGPRLHSPISRKLPARYVMLVGGNDALKAFEGMTLSEEMRQWRRKERRPSLLQEWNNVTTKPLESVANKLFDGLTEAEWDQKLADMNAHMNRAYHRWEAAKDSDRKASAHYAHIFNKLAEEYRSIHKRWAKLFPHHSGWTPDWDDE